MLAAGQAAERRFGGLICAPLVMAIQNYVKQPRSRPPLENNCPKKKSKEKRDLNLFRLQTPLPLRHTLRSSRVPPVSIILQDGRQRQTAGCSGRSHEGRPYLNACVIQVKKGALSVLVWRFRVMLRRRSDAPFRSR